MNTAMRKHADEWVSELRQDPERYQHFQAGLLDAKTGQERLAFLADFAARGSASATQDQVSGPPTMMW